MRAIDEIEFEQSGGLAGLLGMMGDETYGFLLEAAKAHVRVEVRLRYVQEYNVIKAWRVTVDGMTRFSKGSFPES